MSANGVVEPLAGELASLAEFDPGTLDDAELKAALLTLLRCANQLDAVLAHFIGTFDDRKLSKQDAWRSTKQWLQANGRLSGPAAGMRMRAVEITRLLTSLDEAFAAGEVTREHVDRIALTAQDTGDEIIEGAEETLVGLARDWDVEVVQEVCARLVDEALADKRRPPEELHRRRGMTLARVGDMWKLRGILDAETGALLTTAIDAFTVPPAEGDDRNPAQRRHDALADLLNATLREGRTPTVAGVRPHLVLLMPVRRYARLHDHDGADGDSGGLVDAENHGEAGSPTAQGAASPPDGPADLSRWGPVPDTISARLSCDANIQQIWQHPDNGVPLHLGRAYRNTPPDVRRALAARDPNCRWPGCRIPASWCDSHHLQEWVRDHGDTDVDNLVILCRYHHTCAHERGWGVHRNPVNGWITITRPDGTPYELGPSRPRTGNPAYDYRRGEGLAA